MATQTPKLPNNPANYMVPSAVSIWVAPIDENGTLGTPRDLGSIKDLALTLTDEKLNHESFRNGIMSNDKRVIIKTEGQIKFMIDELVGCNLQYMFRPTTTPAAATYTVRDQKRINLTGSLAVIIDPRAVEDGVQDYLDLSWNGTTDDVLVRSSDGSVTYTKGVDYTFTQAAGTGTGRTPATIARIPAGSIDSGAEVTVSYDYPRESTSYQIQEGATFECALWINALNKIGPMFAYYFPFVDLGIDGDLTVNPSEFLSQSFSAEILTSGSGSRGTFYLFDNYQKLTVDSC